jgi:gluconate 5-dehydrogenase
MTERLWKDVDFDAWLCGRVPAARWGDPQELVGTAVFLASAASSYVNGQVIYVEGGLLASM